MAAHNAGLNAHARALLGNVPEKDVGRKAEVDGTVIPLPRYDVSKDQSYWTVVQERRGDAVFLALHDGRAPVLDSLWPPAGILL